MEKYFSYVYCHRIYCFFVRNFNTKSMSDRFLSENPVFFWGFICPNMKSLTHKTTRFLHFVSSFVGSLGTLHIPICCRNTRNKNNPRCKFDKMGWLNLYVCRNRQRVLGNQFNLESKFYSQFIYLKTENCNFVLFLYFILFVEDKVTSFAYFN